MSVSRLVCSDNILQPILVQDGRLKNTAVSRRCAMTKSQRSGDEKNGCSSVCCRVWVLQCSVVAVGCYGQTAKTVMCERVNRNQAMGPYMGPFLVHGRSTGPSFIDIGAT